MKGFTLIELAIVIVIAALLAAVAVPIYNGIVDDSKWSEAKTAVGTIKASVDTYKAKMSGDLTGLTVIPGIVGDGFVLDSDLLVELKLARDAFTTLQYFDALDFTMAIVGVATAGTYSISVDAAGSAVGGQSANGPTTGSGTYTSIDGQYSGPLQ